MLKDNPRISVCIPVHGMANRDFFLARLQDSLERQTFHDFEVVITEEGLMAANTNAAIKKARGDIIKILYMDDYLQPNTLQHIAESFKGGWMASGCLHDDGTGPAYPHTASFVPGSTENTIGSPSVVAFENKDPLLFDENLSWMLDVELYGRLYERYGFPTILPYMDVIIGIGPHQMTNILTDEEKQKEVEYLMNKHE